MKKSITPHMIGAMALALFALIGLSTVKADQADDLVKLSETGWNCQQRDYQAIPLIVCRFSVELAGQDLTLQHSDDEGLAYRHFDILSERLKEEGNILQFAMNAGMYHADSSPVGLYREAGREYSALVQSAADGNFGMLPNGVFWMHDGSAGVMSTEVFAEHFSDNRPDFATQSGPMLVIDGELHFRFREGSENINRRNGVGVSADGKTIYAVISDNVVNFHTFASFFRDELETPNALYLDGFVSRLWANDLGRHEKGVALGPMLVLKETTEN